MRTALLTSAQSRRHQRAYFLVEVLVYLAVVFILLGAGYAAMYRCVDSSVALRRNADDITRALHAGERWRADVRAATNCVPSESDGQLLRLQGEHGEVVYRFATNSMSRRANAGPWIDVLPHVKSSNMKSDSREHAAAFRWDLELETRPQGSVKPSRVRPLFTFLAVPKQLPAP